MSLLCLVIRFVIQIMITGFCHEANYRKMTLTCLKNASFEVYYYSFEVLSNCQIMQKNIVRFLHSSRYFWHIRPQHDRKTYICLTSLYKPYNISARNNSAKFNVPKWKRFSYNALLYSGRL